MKEITNENFEENVLKSEIPVLLDFWAPWCGPCNALTPVIEELAGEFEGKALIAKVNVDNSPQLSIKYGVRNIPTIIIIKDGKQIEKIVGKEAKEVYKNKLLAII